MLSTCPHTPSQTHSLTLFSALFKAGKLSCAGASDAAQLVWGAAQRGALETQDSNRELGTANTGSAPWALSARFRACSLFQNGAQKESPPKGHLEDWMGHTLFPNSMKHSILKQRSVCLLRIATRRKSVFDYSKHPAWETMTTEQTIYQ